MTYVNNKDMRKSMEIFCMSRENLYMRYGTRYNNSSDERTLKCAKGLIISSVVQFILKSLKTFNLYLVCQSVTIYVFNPSHETPKRACKNPLIKSVM